MSSAVSHRTGDFLRDDNLILFHQANATGGQGLLQPKSYRGGSDWFLTFEWTEHKEEEEDQTQKEER